MFLVDRFPYLAVAGLMVVLPAMTGCQGGDDLVFTASPEIRLVEVDVRVDDRSIADVTMHLGHEVGAVRFVARLADSGGPAPGHAVQVEYDIPGMGHRRRVGVFLLHDDGTQGDTIPHDGLYCYEDVSGEYACHGPGEHVGAYHYDFCGVQQDGARTERRRITTYLAQ